jgi:CRP-like cAMP-binding protein
MGSDQDSLYPQLECLGNAIQYVDEIFEIIDRIKLFDDFTVAEVEALCRYMSCFGAPKACRLLTEGCDGDYMILILTGEVAVNKKMASGNDHRIAVATPGMTLGEMSMIDGQPRFASCDTLVPTDFAVLSRHSLNDILVTMPRVGNKLLLELLQLSTIRLRDTCNQLLPHISGSFI